MDIRLDETCAGVSRILLKDPRLQGLQETLTVDPVRHLRSDPQDWPFESSHVVAGCFELASLTSSM